MNAFPLIGISVVDMHPLSTIIVLPIQLVLMTDHINSVHDEQPRLGTTPGWDLRVT